MRNVSSHARCEVLELESMISTVCRTERHHIPEDSFIISKYFWTSLRIRRCKSTFCFLSSPTSEREFVCLKCPWLRSAYLSLRSTSRLRAAWRLVASLSLQRRGFDSRPVDFRFVVKQAALKGVYLRVLLLPQLPSFHQCSGLIFILLVVLVGPSGRAV